MMTCSECKKKWNKSAIRIREVEVVAV